MSGTTIRHYMCDSIVLYSKIIVSSIFFSCRYLHHPRILSLGTVIHSADVPRCIQLLMCY